MNVRFTGVFTRRPPHHQRANASTFADNPTSAISHVYIAAG